jgi:putative ABC transport system permease protein
MLLNYLKVAFRIIRQDKVYSIINILGLSVGMTAFVLVALLIQFMYSFDTFHLNYKQVYRIQQELNDESLTEWTQTPYPLANELKNTIPEIKEAAVIKEIWSEYLSCNNDIILHDLNGFLADPSILKILTFKFIDGEPEISLINPGSVILSKTLAQKLFPGEKALGKMIKGSITKNLIVTGVIEDYPNNSHIKPSYIVAFSTMNGVWGSDNKNYKSDWNNNTYRTYLLLKDNSNPDDVDSKIKNLLDQKVEHNDKNLYLKPLKDVLINPTKEAMSNSPLPYYAAIALFIMVLACINFINLTTARSGLREKEIGIRKVVGGNRFSLIAQFIGESALVSLLAMIVAFLLAKLYLPIFNSYMQTQLEINFMNNWQFMAVLITIFLLVGIFAGVYPAFYLSALRPISVIKFKSGKTGRGSLRRILVLFQFIISITLILSTVFMFKQVDFMKSKDLGYNKTNLIRCRIGATESKSNFIDVRNILLSNPRIIDASISVNTPGHGSWTKEINWEGANEDQKLNVLYNIADYNFINTFKMSLVSGRNFSEEFTTDSNACLINETLARQLEWINPLGKKLCDNKYTVIGVLKDFHPISVHNRIPPYLISLHDRKLTHENDYCVRISGIDQENTIQFVKGTFQTFFPDQIFELKLYETDFDKNTMAVWEGVQSTFGFFSALTIIIALIGLLGLVSYSTRRRTKEIGIRKVLGASERSLYFLLTKEFLLLLGIAIIVASPSAYIVLMTAPGAYKYQVTALDFLIPLVVIVVTTIVVTLKQVLNVTKTNPSESLHYE